MATSTPGRLSSAGVSKAKQLKQLEDGERQAEAPASRIDNAAPAGKRGAVA
jgi:hypothetical protein